MALVLIAEQYGITNPKASFWLKEIKSSILIICVLMLSDVIVGIVSNPEKPWLLASVSHIGFTISCFILLFLVPVLIAQIICLIRSMLFKSTQPS